MFDIGSHVHCALLCFQAIMMMMMIMIMIMKRMIMMTMVILAVGFFCSNPYFVVATITNGITERWYAHNSNLFKLLNRNQSVCFGCTRTTTGNVTYFQKVLNSKHGDILVNWWWCQSHWQYSDIFYDDIMIWFWRVWYVYDYTIIWLWWVLYLYLYD